MDFVATLESNAQLLLAAAKHAGFESPVDYCPGWTVGRLLGHCGKILQRTNLVLQSNSVEIPGDDEQAKLPRDEALFDEFERIAKTLCQTMRTCDLNAPGWNFTGANLTNSFWLRRMAHEIEIHRLDMQDAASMPITPFEPTSAADGIDELIFVLMPVLAGNNASDISASFHLHCTDVDGEWLLVVENGVQTATREHAKGDVAIRGHASSLYQWAWNRRKALADSVEIIGNVDVATKWDALVP